MSGSREAPSSTSSRNLSLVREAGSSVPTDSFEDRHALRILAETSLCDAQGYVEERERFIYVLAHDLRTPLSVILMALQQVRKAEDLSSAHRKTLGRAECNAQRMARMISDLLDFAQGRSGGIPVARAPTELAAICQQALDEVRVIHPSRLLTLNALKIIEGNWDKDRLSQVLSNLLSNAVQYSPVDSTVTVTVSRDSANTVLVEIRNQGQPIAGDELPTLFEPFRRGRKQMAESSRGGIGLGLYIARQIALSHNGTLQGRSNEEEGTVFSLRLPIR